MLTKIRAHNFKSLRNVTLDLGRRNVLVGANMAGKSNVIDLFRFIYDMAFPRIAGSGALVNAVYGRGGFIELLWKGGDDQLIEIGLSGTTMDHVRELPWEYSISIRGEAYGNFRVVSELLRVQRNKALPTDDLIQTKGPKESSETLKTRVSVHLYPTRRDRCWNLSSPVRQVTSYAPQ